jgi:hypothetical protein
LNHSHQVIVEVVIRLPKQGSTPSQEIPYGGRLRLRRIVLWKRKLERERDEIRTMNSD